MLGFGAPYIRDLTVLLLCLQLQTFNIEPPVVSVDALTDGVAMSQVLHQMYVLMPLQSSYSYRADSRFAPSQWEPSLHSNAVSHWLGANLESALQLHECHEYSTFNSHHADFIFLKNENIFTFLSFLNTEMIQEVEIFLQVLDYKDWFILHTIVEAETK